MATGYLNGYLGGGNLKFKEPSSRIQGHQNRSYNNNTLDKSPRLMWGSPALKDNNNLGLNQRGSNGSPKNTFPQQNNEGPSSGSRMPWGSPLSPVGSSFGAPMRASSPKSPFYDNGKKQMQRGGFSGRNYNPHDSGGPGGTTPQHHPNSPRYNSPKSPFGGRGGGGRSPFYHSYQSHGGGGGGSPSCKQNQSGSFNSSRSSSFHSTPKRPGRSFNFDHTPYCSPNSSNTSFNHSYTAEDFYKPSMLEDPWEKLKQSKN